MLDQSAGLAQPGLKDLIGLLTGAERGFGQLIDLLLRGERVAGRRVAGGGGRGAQCLDGGMGLGLKFRTLLRGSGGDRVEGLNGRMSEFFALGARRLGQIAELQQRVGHQPAQRFAARRRPLAHLGRIGSGLLDDLRQLGDMVLRLAGEGAMVSA